MSDFIPQLPSDKARLIASDTDEWIEAVSTVLTDLFYDAKHIQEMVNRNIFAGALTEDVGSIRVMSDTTVVSLGRLNQWSDSVCSIGYLPASQSEKDSVVATLDEVLVRMKLLSVLLNACRKPSTYTPAQNVIQSAINITDITVSKIDALETKITQGFDRA